MTTPPLFVTHIFFFLITSISLYFIFLSFFYPIFFLLLLFSSVYLLLFSFTLLFSVAPITINFLTYSNFLHKRSIPHIYYVALALKKHDPKKVYKKPPHNHFSLSFFFITQKPPPKNSKPSILLHFNLFFFFISILFFLLIFLFFYSLINFDFYFSPKLCSPSFKQNSSYQALYKKPNQ